MTLDPAAAQLLIDAAASGRPNAHLLPIQQARAGLSSFYARLTRPEVAQVADVSIDVHDGAIRGRTYSTVPEGSRPLVVYFHGGGWLLGDIDDYDPLARKLALATDCLILSVDYRKGPEYRFPVAVDDALSSVRWAVQHAAELGVDPTRIVVAGDSAGGNLAAVTAIRCRDENGPALVHQLLVYPVTTCDLTVGFDMRFEGMMLFHDEMQWHQDNYLTDVTQRQHPLVAPLLADLRALPPATIVLAGCDPIAGQGRRYAEALTTAGVTVQVTEYPGMIHGFFGADELFPAAAPAMESAARAIREAVGLVKR